MPFLETLNLNNNPFDEKTFKLVIGQLQPLPRLESLYISLYEEEQVDLVMRMLENLKFLNGLPVERDILDEDESL